MAATELTGKFAFAIADAEDITITDNTVYSTDTTYAGTSYAVAVFLVVKEIDGDENALAVGDDGDEADKDATFTHTLTVGGVVETRAFIVPIFGAGSIAMKIGHIAYDTVSNTWYKANADNTLPATVDSNWTALATYANLDETNVDDFDNAFFVLSTTQTEGYYEIDRNYVDDLIENKLTDLLLVIKNDCHTVCTLNDYELLRRKYEAGASYFDLKNYTKAQELYEDTYAHLNSNDCC